MNDVIKENMKQKYIWIRLLFMVIYAIVNYFVQFIIWLLALIQFIFTLFTSHPDQTLLRFTEGLSAFSYHIMKYLMYNEDTRPYPFSSWPGVTTKEPTKEPTEE